MVQFGGKIRLDDNPLKALDTDTISFIEIECTRKNESGTLKKNLNPESGYNNSQETIDSNFDVQEKDKIILANDSIFLSSKISCLIIDEKLKSDGKFVMEFNKSEKEGKTVQKNNKDLKHKIDQKQCTLFASKKVANACESKAIFSKKFIEDTSSADPSFVYNKRMTLFKTEMCRSFTEAGICKYGDNCQFCHDPKELRIVQRHPKYKTEGCKTFWTEGSCPYGNRCCFVHGEEPEQKINKKQLKFNNQKTKNEELVLENDITFNEILQNDKVKCNKVKFNKNDTVDTSGKRSVGSFIDKYSICKKECLIKRKNHLNAICIDKVNDIRLSTGTNSIEKAVELSFINKSDDLTKSPRIIPIEKTCQPPFTLVIENKLTNCIKDKEIELNCSLDEKYLQISQFTNGFEENYEFTNSGADERFELLLGHSFEQLIEARSSEIPKFPMNSNTNFSPNSVPESPERLFIINPQEEEQINVNMMKIKNNGPWREESIYFIPDMKESRLNKM